MSNCMVNGSNSGVIANGDYAAANIKNKLEKRSRCMMQEGLDPYEPVTDAGEGVDETAAWILSGLFHIVVLIAGIFQRKG